MALTDEESLSFFDAIAPIVHKHSIDLDRAWFQSRYDKTSTGSDGRDYINCALNREQYESFIAALLAGEKAAFKDWERNTPYRSEEHTSELQSLMRISYAVFCLKNK